jgi:haloalkane dehalogenase
MVARSAEDPHPRAEIEVLGTTMSYVDTGGAGDPVVFLHGNPTSSYLWRNVIPPVAQVARCLAPDLVGFGRSGQAPDGSYAFADHARYLDAWADALALDRVVLVLHDWGGALGFDWAFRHSDRVQGIAYLETIVAPLTWEAWPPAAKKIFQGFRSEAGEQLILERNLFVEGVLPASVLRDLSEEEMAVYRAPFAEPGERRRPMLTWPRQLPFVGEGPQDVLERVQAYSAWLAGSDLPKLFVDADPGSILVGPHRDLVRTWPAQTEVTVPGSHFVPEDSGPQIGEAVAAFVGRVRAG